MKTHPQRANPLQRWSAQPIALADRGTTYDLAVSRMLSQVRTTWPSAEGVRASIECVDLGAVAMMRLAGSAHRVEHGHGDVCRSRDHTFHLAVNRASDWSFTDGRGTRPVRMGDAVLIDSGAPYAIEVDDYDIISIRLSEPWIGRWLPSPDRLVGTPLPHDRMWGASLTALVAAIQPSEMGRWPLPTSMVADRIGAQLCISDHLLRQAAHRPAALAAA